MNRKIISIIIEEAENVEERCKGYRKELINLITDIFELERSHRVSATNIQKKIGDKFNAAGQFLTRSYEKEEREI